jgi:hypothetical protein
MSDRSLAMTNATNVGRFPGQLDVEFVLLVAAVLSTAIRPETAV